jgi:translation initiation factor 5A
MNNTSKPGKHGEAKARIEAIGVFDGQKRSIVHPVKHKVHVPMIDKRSAQVLAFMGNIVQLMDLETYETFEMPIPDEFKGQLKTGKEIQYLQALGKKKITRA